MRTQLQKRIPAKAAARRDLLTGDAASRSAARLEAGFQAKAKHVQLAERIRLDVERGALQPGDRLPSFAEMRAQFGVSQDTLERMHRVLEMEGLVVREHRRGIFIALPQRARTGIIGFAGAAEKSFNGFRSPYWSPLVEGIQEAAHAAGLEILLLHADSEPRWDKMDGLLVTEQPPSMLERIPTGMPCVSLLFENPKLPCVLADEYAAACALTQHLLDQGHRRIANLTMGGPASRQRVAGWRDTLRAAGILPQPDWIWNMFFESPRAGFRERGLANMRAWLQHDWSRIRPTALMAHNDDTALGALEALREARIAVPTEVSVTGFDGLDGECAHITSASVPLHDIGRQGVLALLEQIGMPGHGVTQKLPTPLRTGDTTALVRD